MNLTLTSRLPFTLTASDRVNQKAKAMTESNADSPLTFAVPEDDHDEFQRLPEPVRDDVDRGLIAFEAVFNATSQDKELAAQAARFGDRRGWKFQSLRQKYFRYKASGDWRVLVDYARVPKHFVAVSEATVNLPHDFVEYFKGRCQANKRVSEAAIRELYRDWARGVSIPGYGTWQEWFQDEHPHHPLPEQCPPDYPKGWSRGNLGKYLPSKAELALSRGGVAEARTHLPSIITSRVGLRPLEFVLFDDWKPDLKIVVPGFSSPVDLNLLVAMDAATGIILRYGMRPAIPRDDGTKEKLKLADMKCLCAGVLLQFGVPRDYQMTFVIENATATLREATARAFNEVSGGRIDVSRTMMINGTAIFGGYKDKAFGNPRGKGLLESSFNLAGNEMGFAPGQTGRRYDAGPAELAGRTREAEQLLKLTTLTPQQRVQLKLPFLTYAQARVYITDVFNRMSARQDHEMEGFEVVGEWRNAKFQQWRHEVELLALPEAEQALVEWRTPARKETPAERWSRLLSLGGGASALVKLHPGAIARLYEDHKIVEVAAGEISFKLDKELCVYRVSHAENALAPIADGKQFLAYFDASDLAYIHLTDGKGGYVASIKRTRGVRRGDKAAMAEQMTEQRERLHELQDRVSRRMPHVAEEHLDALKNNAEVLADADATEITPRVDAEGAPLPAFADQIAQARTAEHQRRVQEAANKVTEQERTADADEAIDELYQQSKQSPAPDTGATNQSTEEL